MGTAAVAVVGPEGVLARIGPHDRVLPWASVTKLVTALAALEEAGASAADVVRTRIFVTDRAHMDEVMRAHGEVFRETKPACTGIVTELIDPRWLVEIEVEGILQA